MNEEQKLKAEDAKWRRAELKRCGRPEPSWEENAKAKEAVRRRRAELVRRLTICTGARSLQFDPVMVENLDRTIEMCLMFGSDDKAATWAALVVARDDRKKWKAAIATLERRSPLPLPGPLADMKKTLSIINANIAYHERFLGKGKAAGKAWHYPARLIGERVLEVLQSAHEAAGHKTSVRYTDAILQFICEKLAPVCEQVGEESPALDTLRNELTRRRATDAP